MLINVVRVTRRIFQTTTRNVPDCMEITKDWEMKARLEVDDYLKILDFNKNLFSKETRIAALDKSLSPYLNESFESTGMRQDPYGLALDFDCSLMYRMRRNS